MADNESDFDDGQFQNQPQVDYKQEVQVRNAEMQAEFNKMAEKHDNQPGFNGPVITTKEANVLVDEMSDLLKYDCDVAKGFFGEFHPDFKNNFGEGENPYMEYDTFKRVLVDALDEQAGFAKQHQQESNQDIHQDQQYQDSPSKPQNTDPNMPKDDMYQPQEKHFEEEAETNIYTRHNNMIFGNFIHSHNKELLNYFTDFSKESSGEPLVMGQDIPLIMRVAFYIDNITFHQTKEDPDEFFNKEESYKIVIAQMDKYLQTQQNIDVTTVDVTTYKFQFIQFLDFVEYFLQNEPDIFLRRTDDDDQVNQTNVADQSSYAQESDLEKEIKQNIEKYENMLDEAQTENERIVINNMLKALYDQLSKMQSIKEPMSAGQKKKRKLTKEEIRKKNLNEIFLFYCRQQYTQAPKYSFDRILYECHTMNLSNFLLFAKQFKVNNYCLKLTKKMLPALFKKVSNNYKDLTFQEFQILLEKIALLMFEDKEDLPTEFDKIEAFYKYIGVDDSNFYRKHMHILNPPFNIQDPVGFRHLPKDKERNIELKRIPGKMAAELEKRKKEREMLVQKFVSMTPGPVSSNLYKSNNTSRILKPSQTDNPFQPPKNHVENYSTRNQQKQLSKLNLQNKVSWQQLGKISYTDMKQIQQNSRFKPSDLFNDQAEQEDKVYLKQYDLEQEKARKQELSYIHRKEQEQYGNIGNGLRPSQKYLLKHDPGYGERGYNHSNVHRSHLQEDPSDPYYGSQNYGTPYNQQQQMYKSGHTKNNHSSYNINQNYQRAQQVDEYQRQREQQMLYNNERQMERGMYAAKR